VPARTAKGRGTAFLLDDKLWRIGAPAAAAANSSSVFEVTQEEWDGYERGVDLVGPPR
jgi:hypothetical protein